MLCPSCRRRLARGARVCDGCGAAVDGAGAALELVLADATRVPVVAEMTIGRAPGATLVLSDPTVSRVHARISGGAMLEDAGSSHGTFLDGERLTAPSPLRDGARIRLGDLELRVERRRDAAEAGRTIVVAASVAAPPEVGAHPRVRPGYALKRLEASEGAKRWVLKDLETGGFLRLSDNDAALFERLDGTRSLADLVRLSEAEFGARGPARLARLLADLGERGFLTGVASSSSAAAGPGGRLARAFKPREKIVPGVGARIERLYRAGGWVAFTRPAQVAIGVLVVAGIGAFAGLTAGRYGTPFVVASKFGLGGLVFLLGRFAVVAVHEVAHGLTMASFGRRVERAGFKLVAIFPYAFVDTSEAWFEPRRRRIAISAAGPVADFSVGAVFALACLFLPEGTVRDICFNVAFAAYVGGFFNLNPFIERDGYHMLVDWLREPGLRRRAKAQLARRLRGEGAATDSPVLARYAAWGLVWSVVAACFAIAMTLRYEAVFLELAPAPVVYGVMGTLWAAFFAPVVLVVGGPLWQRVRGG